MSKQKVIEQCLTRAVADGRWKLFERIPPERILAEELGVNRTTLRAAIIALAARGIFETRHGSGTYVRALPSDDIGSSTLREKLDACLLLVPSILRSCAMCIRPSQLLELERIFPVAGMALRNDDMHGFVQAQMQFFMEISQIIGNESINASMAACLPDGKSLLHLLKNCGLTVKEGVFAHLAGMLSALRHADAEEAMAAAGAYFANLKSMAESA